jgi:hypothetical protein
MSGFVNVALFFPRYMMVTGFTVLALVYFMPQLQGMGENLDFELIMPYAIKNFIPVGLTGVLIAGLLAAFMSTFAATVNAAPPYIVNDIYKRYINPNADPKKYVRLSYVASLVLVVAGIAFFRVCGRIHQRYYAVDCGGTVGGVCRRERIEMVLVALQWIWFLHRHGDGDHLGHGDTEDDGSIFPAAQRPVWISVHPGVFDDWMYCGEFIDTAG